MSAPDASGWQDISSAPKDGSKFHGLVGEDLISMFWHPDFHEFVSSFSRMTLAPGMTFADTGKNYQDHHPEVHKPTHWKPFSTPPRNAS